MSIKVGREEKLERLQEIRETVNEFPVIPTFKDPSELRWSLDHGNVDFISNNLYWMGPTEGRYQAMFPRLRVSQIKPWCQATIGYSIRATSVDEAMNIISMLNAENKGVNDFIYMRVVGPAMPWNSQSYVDTAMAEYSDLEAELSTPDDFVRRDLHDF